MKLRNSISKDSDPKQVLKILLDEISKPRTSLDARVSLLLLQNTDLKEDIKTELEHIQELAILIKELMQIGYDYLELD